MTRPLLCLDFDGVIHEYRSPWQGVDVVADGPVPGAIAFIDAARQRFSIAIYSARSSSEEGRAAMREAIRTWAVEELGYLGADILVADLQWPTGKPSAFLTIDDRAIQFNGDWSTHNIDDLLNFKPWNKRRPELT